MTDNLTRLQQLLDTSSHTVIFTGAGISTESGIPDFRSPGGVWDRYQPIYFEDFLSSEEMRRESWRRKLATDKVMQKAQPNAGHQCIARWVEQNKAQWVITQNIDNLHQASGVPEECVIELHGNSTYAKCLECAERYDLEPILTAFAKDGSLPHCLYCGGMVKTGTISFGQPMPTGPMAKAEEVTQRCELFIVIGSSLAVYPAAGFPQMAAQRGADLVIINREPTPLDELATVIINGEIGEILQSLVSNR